MGALGNVIMRVLNTAKVISMEAEQLNTLSFQLKDLRARTAELRRYL